MQTKLATLKAAASRLDWQGALRIAAKFDQLGEQKAAIMRGHEAHANARWAVQLGRDPAADIEAGIAALCERYHLNRDGTDKAPRSLTARRPTVSGPPARPRSRTPSATARRSNCRPAPRRRL